MAGGAGLAAGEIASNVSPEQIEAAGEAGGNIMGEGTTDLLLLGGGIVVVGAVAYYLYIKSGLKVANDLVKGIAGGTEWIWGQTTGFFDSAGEFVSGGVDDIGNFFGDVGSGASDFMGDIGSGASDVFGDIGSGLGDVGSNLKFWRIIYEDTTLIVKQDGEVISGETANMIYVFEDGTGLVSEGTLERENKMKIPSNVKKLTVEVPSEDYKESIKFE